MTNIARIMELRPGHGWLIEFGTHTARGMTLADALRALADKLEPKSECRGVL